MPHAIMGVMRRLIAPRRNPVTDSAIDELRAERTKLQLAKQALGGDVWGMLETGDPLGALAHGARTAQFHTQIASDPK